MTTEEDKQHKLHNKEEKKGGKMAGLLTTGQVAEILNMHRNTVLRKCRTGDIPAVKLFDRWRIRRTDLVRLLQGEEKKEGGG
jgi:excisionase family DNA binding protein